MSEKQKSQEVVEAKQAEFLQQEILSLISGYRTRVIILSLDKVKQEVLKNASYRREQDT